MKELASDYVELVNVYFPSDWEAEAVSEFMKRLPSTDSDSQQYIKKIAATASMLIGKIEAGQLAYEQVKLEIAELPVGCEQDRFLLELPDAYRRIEQAARAMGTGEEWLAASIEAAIKQLYGEIFNVMYEVKKLSNGNGVGEIIEFTKINYCSCFYPETEWEKNAVDEFSKTIGIDYPCAYLNEVAVRIVDMLSDSIPEDRLLDHIACRQWGTDREEHLRFLAAIPDAAKRIENEVHATESDQDWLEPAITRAIGKLHVEFYDVMHKHYVSQLELHNDA